MSRLVQRKQTQRSNWGMMLTCKFITLSEDYLHGCNFWRSITPGPKPKLQNHTISISIRSFIYKIWVEPAAGSKDFYMLRVYQYIVLATFCLVETFHFIFVPGSDFTPTTCMYGWLVDIHFAANSTRVCTIRDRQGNQPRWYNFTRSW